MNTREKIALAADPARLCLHKEGIFYKLYNRHAMLFVENIKELKIKVKFIKTVNQFVYSAGFPASIVEPVRAQLVALGGVPEESGDLLTVAGICWPKESDYRQWAAHQEKEAVATEQKHCEQGAGPATLAQRIAGFQVMNKTPMEAMNFIIELQGMLGNDNE